jgi:localization factor PodJL
MNIKTSARSQKQNRMTVPNAAQGEKKTLNPANASLPVSMGKDKSAYIVKLLDTVSQQLRRSEAEREMLWKELEETRRLVTDLEERTGRSEKSYSFMREQVERTEQNSTTFIEQLTLVDARARSAAERADGVSEESTRISRKIERLSQDKVRLNRKVNIIEETVTSTREALEAKALVLLTDRAVAERSTLPQISGAEIFNDRNDVTPAKTPEAMVDEERAKIKQHLFGGVSISVLLALGVAAVWGFSHFGPSLQLTKATPQYVSEVQSKQDRFDRAAIAPTANNVYAPDTASPTDFDALEDKIDKTLLESGGDINAVAAALNDLEPSALAQGPSIGATPPVEIQDIAVPEVDKVDVLPKIKATPMRAEPIIEDMAQSPEVVVKDAVAKPAVALQAAPEVIIPEKVVVSAADIAKSLRLKEEAAAAKLFSVAGNAAPLSERAALDKSLNGFAKDIQNAAFSGNPEAQHDLAALYTAGQEGVAQDFEKAFFWFKESGKENVANSRYNLGVLYQQGLGTLKNVANAMDMYRSAALLGHPEAQYNLGIAYAEGIGVPYSIESAVHYFEQSAVTGVPESAYNLGLIFENGLTGKKDHNKALFWYNLASDNNNVEAQNALGQLTAKLGLSLGEVRNIVRVEQNQNPAFKAKAISGVAKAMPQAVASVAAARPQHESEIIDVRSVMSESADYSLIAPIQEHLMALGLYPGPADGISGPMTADAIRSYQTMFNISPDGKASSELVEHMMNNMASASGQ